MWTNDDFQANLQTMRNVYCKVEVLNMKHQIVDYIEGKVTGGSISINNSNMSRRSLDITFVVDDDRLEISEMSPLWISKRLKIYTGLEDYFGTIHWFNQGIYILKNPTTDVSQSGRYIKITGADKMELFNHPFTTDIKFSVDTPVDEAIKGMLTLIGETNMMIEKSDYKIPYDLQFSLGSSMMTAIKDITNLYLDYHSYYDVNGYYIFEKIKNRKNDPSIWDFTEEMDLTVSRQRLTVYDDIKNYVKVVGKINEDTGILPLYEIKIQGYDKPLSIENIGLRPKVVDESKYSNVAQCKSRAEYEIEKSQNMANQFSIESVAIYLLNDVNKLVNIYDNGVVYKCLIDTINIPLDLGTMSITAHEIF